MVNPFLLNGMEQVEQIYKVKLPSFEVFNQTGNEEDLTKMIKSHHSYVNDVVEITGRSYPEVLTDFANYHKTRELLIQPRGISAITHKIVNGGFVSWGVTHTFFATTTSHISGITGMALLGAAPGVPLVGGVFY